MDIPQHSWEIIEAEIVSTGHGTVALIVQDSRLVQMDKTEKIRLVSLGTEKSKPPVRKAENLNRRTLRQQIGALLDGLQFGQIVVIVKDNQVSQIEKLEKQRIADLSGLFGEGI